MYYKIILTSIDPGDILNTLAYRSSSPPRCQKLGDLEAARVKIVRFIEMLLARMEATYDKMNKIITDTGIDARVNGDH